MAPQQTGRAAPFLAGVFTTVIVGVVLVVILILEISPRIVKGRLFKGPDIEISAEFIEELARLDALVANADNPTRAREHDTILVRPDPDLGYTLRPGARIDAYMMPAGNALNLDPPVVYLPTGADLSPALASHLESESDRFYQYEIDEHGRRRTLPVVRSERKILMVGDSAMFGVGVGDAHTIASWLQLQVGDEVEVVNAGVGGYDGARAAAVARKLSDAEQYESLVYVAHHNDFEREDRYSVALAQRIVDAFAPLAGRFAGGVVIATVPYMEYVSRGLFRQYGFRSGLIESSHELWQELPGIVGRAGFGYVNGVALARATVRRSGSVFAPLAFYADHAHLSPGGNRTLAKRIHARLSRRAR